MGETNKKQMEMTWKKSNHIFTAILIKITQLVLLVEQELLTFLNHMNLPPYFVCGIYLLCSVLSFRHYIGCVCDFWLPLIGKLDIFHLMCAVDKVWVTELTLIHKNIRSVCNLHAQVYWSIWRKTQIDVTDKNNNISSEGPDRHYHKYHSSSYQTRWDISDRWCLSRPSILPLFYMSAVWSCSLYLLFCDIFVV